MVLKSTHLHLLFPTFSVLLLNDITVYTTSLNNVQVSEEMLDYSLSHLTRVQKVPVQFNVMKQQT